MYVTTLDRDADDVQFATADGGRTAGYAYDGAAYCVACAGDIEVSVGGEVVAMPAAADRDAHDEHGFGVGRIRTTSEADAPGLACDVCHQRLPTRVLHYDD